MIIAEDHEELRILKEKCEIHNDEIPKYCENLTERVFGRLTVLGYSFTWKKRIYWVVECNCKNKTRKVIRADSLKDGSVKSCGCLHSEIVRLDPKDDTMINRRFGKLTVIKRVEGTKKSKAPRYLCKCDCGGFTTTTGNCLKTGHTKSCGCLGSRGEAAIHQFCFNNNIDFIPQYKDERLKDKGILRFDTKIFYNNKDFFLCEFQGIQHYYVVRWNEKWTDEEAIEHFKIVQRRDELKRQFCKENNIRLLEISYKDINKIPQILAEELGLSDYKGIENFEVDTIQKYDKNRVYIPEMESIQAEEMNEV